MERVPQKSGTVNSLVPSYCFKNFFVLHIYGTCLSGIRWNLSSCVLPFILPKKETIDSFAALTSKSNKNVWLVDSCKHFDVLCCTHRSLQWSRYFFWIDKFQHTYTVWKSYERKLSVIKRKFRTNLNEMYHYYHSHNENDENKNKIILNWKEP